MVALSEAELHALLAAAKVHRERDWLMILVAFSHGLRPREVVGGWAKKNKKPYYHNGITPDDIRDGFLTVQRLKGSMRTTQALVEHPDSLLSEVPELANWAAKSRPNQNMFGIKVRQFQNIVLRHGTMAGIPRHKLTPHKLKHSIAMQTIHSAGIENVRQHLGHKSLSSTGAYLKVTDEDAGRAIAAARGVIAALKG